MEQYLVNGTQMKQIDIETIENVGIPSLVLMERASLAVALSLEKKYGKQQRILCICGTGNNGADGIAVSRILRERGHQCDIYVPKKSEFPTKEWERQLSIAEMLKIPVLWKSPNWNEYTVLVDAIFGIGLSRAIDGIYKQVIEEINTLNKHVVSVDIPSGICAKTGQIFGVAIKAELTVTFGLIKTGLIRYPGAEYAGEIQLENPGFPKSVIDKFGHDVYTYTEEVFKEFPKRSPEGNKGTFGKVAVIAGSENMAGASYFAASAAYRMGVGLVNVCTCEENREILQIKLPEAVLTTWNEKNAVERTRQVMEWADVIVAGPGIGKSKIAEKIILEVLKYAMEHNEKPVVLDADGLNLFSELSWPEENLKGNFYFTPHLGEFSRLTGKSVAKLKEDLEEEAREYVKTRNLCLICKDARTIVTAYGENRCYLNRSGCSGMGTAGSGDVLSGVLAGILTMGISGQKAGAYAVYFHGKAGEIARKYTGNHALCASNLLDGITELWREIEESEQKGGAE